MNTIYVQMPVIRAEIRKVSHHVTVIKPINQ